MLSWTWLAIEYILMSISVAWNILHSEHSTYSKCVTRVCHLPLLENSYPIMDLRYASGWESYANVTQKKRT